MKLPNKLALSLGTLGLIAGAATTLALQTHAQTSGTTNAGTTTQSTTNTASGTTEQNRPHGHAPLGGDGNVTAINGTTVTMQEEADEGGTSYTVDASKATVTNNGATGTLSDLMVGDKIFVQGTTSGTNIAATTVSLGHPEMGGHHGRFSPDQTGNASGTTSVQ